MSRIVITVILLLGGFLAGHTAEVAIPSLDERVKEKQLDNGLKVVVVERHTVPTFFAILGFRVGSASEEQNSSGLSHFLEHMMFKGTETIGTTNLAAEKKIMDSLEVVALKMKMGRITLKPWRYEEFDRYARTVRQNLPDSIRQKVGGSEALALTELLKALPVDIANLPTELHKTPWMLKENDTNYWTIYRGQIALRIRLLELTAEQKKYIPLSEPYDGIYDPMGSQGYNAGTTRDRTEYEIGLPSNCLEQWMWLESDRFLNPVFREFYPEKDVVLEELRMGESEPSDVLYRETQSLLFKAHPYGRPIIGWDEDVFLTVRSDMERHFNRFYKPNNAQITIVGDVRAEEVFRLAEQYFGGWQPGEPAHEVTVTEPPSNGERRSALFLEAEPQLYISYNAPVAPHPDAYPLAMVDRVLSSGRTSRFYKSIFVNQQLTEDPPWAGAPYGRYDEAFTIGASPRDPHTVEEVESAIYAELDKIINEPVTERELDRIRNKMRTGQLEKFRSNDYLANVLSGAFAHRGDWRSITADFERMMAVTPADIQRVAKKYFTTRNRTVTYIVKTTSSEENGETDNGEQE